MPRLTFRHFFISAFAIASLQLRAAPVLAADPVYMPPAEPAPVMHRHKIHRHKIHKRVHVVRRHKARILRTSYREIPCGDLWIEYRPPYRPHTEIVRICKRNML